MATDVQAWCRETKSEKWTDDREVDIVGQYLDGTLTATEAAEKLTEYVDRRNTAENKVGRIWTLLQLCAVECADLHEQLIDLIEAIVACSPSKRTGGVDWTEQETSFKETWRDYYDCEFSLGLVYPRLVLQSSVPNASYLSAQCQSPGQNRVPTRI